MLDDLIKRTVAAECEVSRLRERVDELLRSNTDYVESERLARRRLKVALEAHLELSDAKWTHSPTSGKISIRVVREMQGIAQRAINKIEQTQ